MRPRPNKTPNEHSRQGHFLCRSSRSLPATTHSMRRSHGSAVSKTTVDAQHKNAPLRFAPASVKVGLGKRECVPNELDPRLALFRHRHFHDIEAKKNVGLA